jgi:acetyl-CoA carboxylase biotin carboxyl carrier protein
MPPADIEFMKRMNLDEIKQLLDMITERDISEFELERGDEKIRIKRGSSNNSNPLPYIVVASPGQIPGGMAPPAVGAGNNAASGASSSKQTDGAKGSSADTESDNWTMVAAPIVGTFYEASSPGAPAFVQVGDRVEPGQVLCIIEAMKLMNEIEAEVGGVITKRFVQNAQPVEFGESLFAIKPNA